MRERASPRTISGTPTRWRPPGIPGKGGSSWVMASPATTSATAVRFHARKVRSLAKVKRASGSTPCSRIACLADPEDERAVLLGGRQYGHRAQQVAGVDHPVLVDALLHVVGTSEPRDGGVQMNIVTWERRACDMNAAAPPNSTPSMKSASP